VRERNSTVQRLYSDYSRETLKNNMVLVSMARREEIPLKVPMVEGNYLDPLGQKYCPTNPATK